MLKRLNVPEVALRQTSFALPEAHGDSAGWTLGTLIEIVARRIGLVAKVTAVVVLAALIYLLFAVPRFTATASLIPDMRRAPPAPGEVSQETLIDPAIVENQIEAIRSEKVALAVIDKLELWNEPEFAGDGSGLIDRALSAINMSARSEAIERDLRRRTAANKFARMLKVVRAGRSYVTEISFTSTDPLRAAMIANEVADTYIQDQLGAKFSNSERSSRWMRQRIAELEQETAAAAKAIEDLKTGNNLELDANGEPAAVREKEELTQSLGLAKAETARLNSRSDRLQSTLHAEDRTELPDSGYLDAAEDETVVRLRDQYRVMQSELPPRPLDQRERGPDDSALAAKLAEQRDKLWNAVYADAEAVKKNLEAARLREATIVRRLQEITPRLDAVHAQLETLKALNAKHQSAQQLRDSLQNRYARVSQFIQQQSIPVTEARIITEATPPLSKSSPKRTLIFLLALFGGGVLGIGSAIGREHFDRTVRRPEQIERELGVRPLGAVQLFGGRAKDSPSRPRSAPDARQKQTNGTDKGPFLTRRIESWLAGPAGETLRRVKIALDEGVRTSQGRVLAVVSPNAREGKTTIALALAVIMARAGKRTCLIDADIREPSLTRALTPGATGGLVSIIGQKPLFADEGVRQLHGFHFIGQGPGFSACHPSEVLGSEAMQDMLDNLRGRFDYIIVDTPPLLPYVDVAAAAGTLDAFVLVAESGRTTIEDLRRSFSASDPIEERLVGVLINKSPRAKR